MRKAQVLFSVALVLLCGSFAKAAVPTNGSVGAGADDGLITLVYDPANGSLSLDAAGKELTALEVLSAGSNFKGAKPAQVNGLFDVFTPAKFFILKPGNARFGDQDFGTALAPGLTKDQVGADLTVSGALFPSGGLGTVDLMYVPEPSSMGLLSLGLLGLIRARRNK